DTGKGRSARRRRATGGRHRSEEEQDRPRPPGPRALRRAVRACQPPVLRCALRPLGRRARHGDRRRHGPGRPRRSPDRSGQDLQRRHEAAAESGRRTPARSRHPAARRTDSRRRSAKPQRDLREPRTPEVAWQGAPLHHPLHGRSRAPRGSHRRHGPRKSDRRRYACRPAVPRRCRRREGDARVGIPHADGKEPARLMSLIPLSAMVRKDLQLFFSDKRSVIVSFVVPIAIASFFGSIFSVPSRSSEPAKIAVAIIDQDSSPISTGIVAGMQADKNFKVTTPPEAEARDAVLRWSLAAAVIIPKRFGDAAGNAFFGDGAKPPLNVIFDPSRSTEKAMVSGIMTQHVMESVSKEMFGGAQGRAMVERTLPQIQGAQMPEDEKRALINMLSSVQQFYNRQPS